MNADKMNYNFLKENIEMLPFGFEYDNKLYFGFSDDDFKMISQKTVSDRNRKTCLTIYELKDEIKISVKLSGYESYDATEWTVEFENISPANSKIISNWESVMYFEGEKPVLKGILGDLINQYHPYEKDLTKESVSFVNDSGRATHEFFPYFNLEYGNGGAFLAIGWAGTWSADFSFENNSTKYRGNSVNNIKTYLKPGEKIRTALYVVFPYNKRDENYATNLWRRWFIECNMPKADNTGRSIQPHSFCSLASDTGLPQSDGSISECYTTWRPTLEKMFEEDCKVDFRWFDAGWYMSPDLGSAEPFVKGHDWWDTVGTWELDPVKWPGKTFLESTDFARAHGMKTLMWFEPERVTFVDSLAENFGYNKEWAISMDDSTVKTNNFGNEECYQWTKNRVCKTLRENKVEMYREDNNSNAGSLWCFMDKNEGENRIGITECKMIINHYRLWDDIIECTLSYGGCGFVDSCASGGGRNDLESMRRGVPLLRSDSDRTSTALRLAMTTSFNKWIPYCGANTKEKEGQIDLTGNSDQYIWRASYLPALNVDSQFVQDPYQDFSILRNGLKEWKKVNKYLLKDFYILTPWHDDKDKARFTSYCFYDDIDESGYIFGFRMEECEKEKLCIKLPFASSSEKYALTDEDSGKEELYDGEALLKGIELHFEQKRTARLIAIKKL